MGFSYNGIPEGEAAAPFEAPKSPVEEVDSQAYIVVVSFCARDWCDRRAMAIKAVGNDVHILRWRSKFQILVVEDVVVFVVFVV